MSEVANTGGANNLDTTTTLAFGGSEGLAITNDGTLTLNGLITGTAGLTISGAGT